MGSGQGEKQGGEGGEGESTDREIEREPVLRRERKREDILASVQ